jgi:hypothetical protein
VAEGIPGAYNDKTKIRFDALANSMRAGKYSNIAFRVRTVGGAWQQLKGLYLIVDGGYHQWRMLQCPVKETTDLIFAHFFEHLESVRKDVECAFGRLKARFRCLKIPVQLHQKQDIDNMFVTCCILHNMLLDDDGYDVPFNPLEVEAGFSDVQDGGAAPQFRHPVQRGVWLRAFSTTDFSSMGHYPIPPAHETTVEQDDTWFTLQRQLAVHFNESYKRNELHWF